jgi:transmembrane sensor
MIKGKFFVVCLLLAGAWHCKGRGGDGSLVTRNETGQRKKISLPDGTEIVMKTGTTIRLAREFNGKARELWLEGEALFDVTVDAGKPFIVHTRNLKILVLGTRFRVDADPKTPGEEVDLLSGKLQVMKSYHSDTDNEPETIETGEMVMINRDIDLMEKEKMDGSEMRGWDAGK